MHGWLILDKPIGLGSTQGVSAVKRNLREGGYGKHRVGHGGTLDPLATGVLPIAIGEATKLAGRMLDADKVYEFTVRFGVETDTLDLEGIEIATSPARPTRAEIQAVLPRFTGPIDQVPPAFSALKVDGRRAYDLARAGEAVVLATRSVVVHALQMRRSGEDLDRCVADAAMAHSGPGLRRGDGLDEATFTATVSKGTYIRSLARDIARALGTVGHVTMLRRTKAGPFTLDSAISLDNLNQAGKARGLEQHLLPLTAGLDDIPALPVDPDQARALRQGRKLIGCAAHQGLQLAIDQNGPVALVETTGIETRVVRGFNL